MSNPIVLSRRHELFRYIAEVKAKNHSIGFVPTMGALHEGHASLLKKARGENDCCILSIFVNPKQFGPKEDYSHYPRTLREDLLVAKNCGVDAVFAPTVSEMYPENFLTSVHVAGLGDGFCGPFRPGHFDGVVTVVLLLLNLVQANRAYFGTKDFQQLTIIQKMCRDLAYATEIIGVETLREADGLALSSRNKYLDTGARARARFIPLALAAAAKAFLDGERDVKKILEKCLLKLSETQLSPQYLELREVENLQPITGQLPDSEGGFVLALAQFVENDDGLVKTRLIDNIVLANESGARARLEELVKISKI